MSFAEIPFLDSFKHYSTSTYQGKWTTFGGSLSGTGREGGAGFVNGTISKTFANSYASFYSGFAFNMVNGLAGTSPLEFFSNITQNANGQVGGLSITLLSLGDGHFYVQITWPGVSTFTSGLFTPPLAIGTWFYVELGATINIGGGTGVSITYSIRINNIQVVNETHTFSNGSDGKQLTVNIGWNAVQLQMNGTQSWTASDFYVASSGFYGDGVVEVHYPNGAGNYTNWTPLASTNWSQVSEHPPDDNTSYNAAGTSPLKDSYTHDAMGTTGNTIKAVQLLTRTEKDASGTATYQQLTRISGTDYLGQTFAPSALSYQYFLEASEVSPASGIAWTPSEFNGAEIGIDRIS